MKDSIIAILLIAASATTAVGADNISYTFTWKNLGQIPQCSMLEINILNYGAVVAQKNSIAPLQFKIPYKMELNSAYCTNIQIKALCNGINNFQTIGCAGGTIEISPSGSMSYFR